MPSLIRLTCDRCSGSLSRVDEPSNTADSKGRFRPAPDLPKPLTDPWPVVIIGTGLWLATFLVMLITGFTGVWRWTALTGAGLGLLGMTVMLWQRVGRYRNPQHGDR